MKAKEMFEKLEYELVDTNSSGVKLTIIEYYNYETTSSITFWTPTNIDVDLENHEYLTAKLIQAINKQAKELGWLDNE